MKPFTIAIDTSFDLPEGYIEKHGIEVMPIPFMLDGIDHNMGYWQEITGKEFYDALRNGGEAKTSQINPDSFVNVFTEYAKKGEDAVFIILSSALSATYQSSLIALTEVKEEYPECNIHSVDSIGATALNGLLAILTVNKRDEGFTAEETAAWLNEKKNSVFGMLTVDDLMYLHRGGRLSKLSAVGGSLLGIKPVINIGPGGSLALKDKVRGRESALKFMVSKMMQSLAPDTALDTVLISHTDCEDDAKKLAEIVRDNVSVKQIEVMMMGPVIGAHTGPGSVALVFEADMTRAEYERKYYSKR